MDKKRGGEEENSRENLTKRKIVANMECYWQNGKQYVLMHLFIYFCIFLFEIDYRVSMHVALCNEIMTCKARVAKHSETFSVPLLCTFFFIVDRKCLEKKLDTHFKAKKMYLQKNEQVLSFMTTFCSTEIS